MCRSSQGLVLSLDVSHEPRVFPGVWRHKGWFAVPNKSLSSEVERILEVPLPTKKSSGCKMYYLRSLSPPECTVKNMYHTMVIFHRSN